MAVCGEKKMKTLIQPMKVMTLWLLVYIILDSEFYTWSYWYVPEGRWVRVSSLWWKIFVVKVVFFLFLSFCSISPCSTLRGISLNAEHNSWLQILLLSKSEIFPCAGIIHVLLQGSRNKSHLSEFSTLSWSTARVTVIFHNCLLIQLHREYFYFREIHDTAKGFTSLRGKKPSKH